MRLRLSVGQSSRRWRSIMQASPPISTDPLGRRTTLTQCAWGPLVRSEDPLGSVTHYEHDAFGALLRVRDALGNERSVGRLQRARHEALGRRHGSRDLDWTRNALGETTALRDAKGAVTRYEYDLLGRITKRSAPDGISTWTWGSTRSEARHRPARRAGRSRVFRASDLRQPSDGRQPTRSSATPATSSGSATTRSACSTRRRSPSPVPPARSGSATSTAPGASRRLRNADAPSEAWWTLNAQDAAGNALDEILRRGPAHRERLFATHRKPRVSPGARRRRRRRAGPRMGLGRRRQPPAPPRPCPRADRRVRVRRARSPRRRRAGTARSNFGLDYDAIGNIRA